MEEQFRVSCSEMHFLREQFRSSPMFWNVFFEGAIILDFCFMAAALCFYDCRLVQLVYSYLNALIFISFLSVRTYFYQCVLVWLLNIKSIDIFFLLKTLWHEYQIMKSNIMPHNNITTKSLILIFFITILQLKTFKTQITTNTRTLVYHGPNE